MMDSSSTLFDKCQDTNRQRKKKQSIYSETGGGRRNQTIYHFALDGIIDIRNKSASIE